MPCLCQPPGACCGRETAAGGTSFQPTSPPSRPQTVIAFRSLVPPPPCCLSALILCGDTLFLLHPRLSPSFKSSPIPPPVPSFFHHSPLPSYSTSPSIPSCFPLPPSWIPDTLPSSSPLLFLLLSLRSFIPLSLPLLPFPACVYLPPHPSCTSLPIPPSHLSLSSLVACNSHLSLPVPRSDIPPILPTAPQRGPPSPADTKRPEHPQAITQMSNISCHNPDH